MGVTDACITSFGIIKWSSYLFMTKCVSANVSPGIIRTSRGLSAEGKKPRGVSPQQIIPRLVSWEHKSWNEAGCTSAALMESGDQRGPALIKELASSRSHTLASWHASVAPSSLCFQFKVVFLSTIYSWKKNISRRRKRRRSHYFHSGRAQPMLRSAFPRGGQRCIWHWLHANGMWDAAVAETQQKEDIAVEKMETVPPKKE